MLPEPAEILATWPRPAPAVVWRAIEIYLDAAYGDAPPPAAVRQRLEKLPRDADPSAFYSCGAFEMLGAPTADRYALRLGNSIYPHMKMVIGPTPDGRNFLFRADTHDRHVQVPPNSPEYGPLCQMLSENHAIGSAIESAWDAAGVPTFKQYLRQDLARRRDNANPPISPPPRGGSSGDPHS